MRQARPVRLARQVRQRRQVQLKCRVRAAVRRTRRLRQARQARCAVSGAPSASAAPCVPGAPRAWRAESPMSRRARHACQARQARRSRARSRRARRGGGGLRRAPVKGNWRSEARAQSSASGGAQRTDGHPSAKLKASFLRDASAPPDPKFQCSCQNRWFQNFHWGCRPRGARR